MLAMGRALVLNPRLLLDEPLEGLAPIVVEELIGVIRHRRGRLDDHRGRAAMTDRAAILERGSLVDDGGSRELAADASMLETHLGVTGRSGGKGHERVGAPGASPTKEG